MQPSFWDDPKRAEQILKSIKQKKIWTDAYQAAETAVEDLSVLYEFFTMGEAKEEEVDAAYKVAMDSIESLELKNMLSGE